MQDPAYAGEDEGTLTTAKDEYICNEFVAAYSTRAGFAAVQERHGSKFSPTATFSSSSCSSCRANGSSDSRSNGNADESRGGSGSGSGRSGSSEADSCWPRHILHALMAATYVHEARKDRALTDTGGGSSSSSTGPFFYVCCWSQGHCSTCCRPGGCPTR